MYYSYQHDIDNNMSLTASIYNINMWVDGSW
jgi:hypothetical protein